MAITLAVTDSPALRQALADRALPVDAVETTGPRAEEAAAHFAGRPLLLHNSVWDTSLAHPTAFARDDLVALTRRLLRLTGAPFLSVHLGFAAAEVAYADGAMQARSAALDRDELLARTCASVRRFAAALPVPLILENLDRGPTDAYRHVCQADFIAAVLEATDSDLLLDLAHAQVTASRLGLKVEDYLAGLPLARVRQLHLSGPRPGAGGTLRDAHEVLREADYDLLARVLTRARPEVVTLEYHREPAALVTQVERLRDTLDRHA
ncbi:MAG TPA: DUF692 family protein [Thermomicrobiaceae bacterium]|nr:DUF692 family protein [Thermomicrobiaceae bacterium]